MIVGSGRIGLALEKMGGGQDIIVRRGEKVPDKYTSNPIFVCTRNDVLDDVLAATPRERWEGMKQFSLSLCVSHDSSRFRVNQIKPNLFRKKMLCSTNFINTLMEIHGIMYCYGLLCKRDKCLFVS